MDSRSKLGFVLHRCCCKNALRTFTEIIKLMERISFSLRFSIILEASVSFCLNYIPTKDRDTLVEFSLSAFRRHSISEDPEHITSLTQFLQSGGTSLIPSPAMLLSDLLERADKIGPVCRKAIGLLIEYSPTVYSPVFWQWFFQHDRGNDGIAIISEITIYATKLKPIGFDTQLSQLEELCKENIDITLPFSRVEPALLTLRWLTRVKKFIPLCVFPNYSSGSLNALAISCWAEYARYGNLSLIPTFPQSSEIPILRGYAEIFSKASKNPNFSLDAINVPHWLWHSCRQEFGRTSLIPPQSILSLSLVELDCALEIAHVLPSFVFVHCMRIRTRNTDVMTRLIRIVAQTPSSILGSHIDDFEDFVDSILEHPSLVDELSSCFRELAISLRPHFGRIINKLCASIDYFDGGQMCGRLQLLNSILVFTCDLEPFVDVFDSVWESLGMIDLSLSLCRTILDFFVIISRYSGFARQYELHFVSIAALAAMFVAAPPECILGHPISEKIFEHAKKFYSFISSDIVVSPRYSIKGTFELTQPALLLCNQLLPNDETTPTILKMLPPLLDVCPIEATALATHLIPYSKDHPEDLSAFCSSLKMALMRDTDSAFVMVAGYFQERVREFISIDLTELLRANIFGLTDDVSATRVNLQLDHELAPLLLTKSAQLSLMLENWAPPIPDVFLQVISAKFPEISKNAKAAKDERRFRSFLSVFGFAQPSGRRVGWISREFLDHDTKAERLDIFCADDTEESMVKGFARAYAIPPGPDVPVAIARMYGSSAKVAPFLRRLLAPRVDKLAEDNANQFWMLRLLGALKIRYKFPQKARSIFCRALGIRIRALTAPEPADAGDGFLALETLTAYGPEDERRKTLLIRLKSPSLALRFSTRRLSPAFLKILIAGQLPSQKRAYLFHMAGFAEITGDAAIVQKYEETTAEALKSIDLSSPVLFREAFLLIVALVAQSGVTIDSHSICDAFLCSLPKSPSSAPLYETMPLLERILKSAGDGSPGRVEVERALAGSEFDRVSYSDFQQVRSNIAVA